MDSILDSIKQLLGISPEDKSFDIEIVMHINSVFMKLALLGIGPKEGYYIQDNTTKWTDYITDRLITEPIKTYMFLKVKLIFDIPQNAAVIEAMKQSAEESEYIIREWAEEKASAT